MSINRLLHEADYLVSKSMNFSLTLETESSLVKSGKSAFSIDLFWYPNLSFPKSRVLRSSIKVWIEGVKLLDDSQIKQSLIFSIDWSLDINQPKSQESPINIVALSIFKFTILESYRLEFFRQGLHREIFKMKNRFFLKVICGMFDQSLPQLFDGKYGSATASLVKFSFLKVQKSFTLSTWRVNKVTGSRSRQFKVWFFQTIKLSVYLFYKYVSAYPDLSGDFLKLLLKSWALWEQTLIFQFIKTCLWKLC